MTGTSGAYAGLQKLLTDSAVRIRNPPSGTGTGFFVGPGLVVTCAHVVAKKAGGPADEVVISWNGQEYPAHIEDEKYFSSPTPDIALLRVSIPDNPYVAFYQGADPAAAYGDVLAYGFPGTKLDGDYATFQTEGTAPGDHALLKLKLGQAEAGMSGAPVLSLATGTVCGMLRLSRGVSTDLGARAIPAQSILTYLPELIELQNQRQPNVHRWLSLLTDAQLEAGQVKFAGPRLRKYIKSIIATSEQHPYHLLQSGSPPLSTVYLRLTATASDDSRIDLSLPAESAAEARGPLRGLIDAR